MCVCSSERQPGSYHFGALRQKTRMKRNGLNDCNYNQLNSCNQLRNHPATILRHSPNRCSTSVFVSECRRKRFRVKRSPRVCRTPDLVPPITTDNVLRDKVIHPNILRTKHYVHEAIHCWHVDNNWSLLFDRQLQPGRYSWSAEMR